MSPLAWLALTAAAHPFGARFAAHLVELEVADDHVQVTYLADVPNPIVQTATRDPRRDPLEAMADELRSGLVLEVDGASVALEPAGPWLSTPTEDTHQFSWTLRAPLDHPASEVRLSNGNLPDVVAVYRARVAIAGSRVPVDCSLWRMRDGAIALDETDRWRTDERNRTVWVRLDRPAGPLSGLWNAAFRPPRDPVLATERWLPPPAEALRTRTPTPPLVAAALGLTAALAAAALTLTRRLRSTGRGAPPAPRRPAPGWPRTRR